ncbi:unannotated protein [freshwater metagenome]|uniref:Unannotated protein n=1 Tax=freshwater metagenome TaxID=449393 RepID=A0A6J6ILB5_9ZZZZ
MIKPPTKLSSARPVHNAKPALSAIPIPPDTAGRTGKRWKSRVSKITIATATGAITEGKRSPVMVNTTRNKNPGAVDSMTPRTPPTALKRFPAVNVSLATSEVSADFDTDPPSGFVMRLFPAEVERGASAVRAVAAVRCHDRQRCCGTHPPRTSHPNLRPQRDQKSLLARTTSARPHRQI